MGRMVLTLLGVGAMASPRYRPAGLLVERPCCRVAIAGGTRHRPAARVAGQRRPTPS